MTTELHNTRNFHAGDAFQALGTAPPAMCKPRRQHAERPNISRAPRWRRRRDAKDACSISVGYRGTAMTLPTWLDAHGRQVDARRSPAGRGGREVTPMPLGSYTSDRRAS